MAWSKSQLSTPLTATIIEDTTAYWSLHFYAIISCLHNHTHLKFGPSVLDSYPVWSLQSLRGRLPRHFFDNMWESMENWGFQYFLSSYMNSLMSNWMVGRLIATLSEQYQEGFPAELTNHTCYISGKDSRLSADLNSQFTEVFPSHLNGASAPADVLVARSDLCLVLSSCDPDDPRKVAVFGEVEVHNGIVLSNSSYWEKRVPFCVFSVGISSLRDCYADQVFLVAKEEDGVRRVHIVFGNRHFVAEDFKSALWAMSLLFDDGPDAQIRYLDQGFQSALDLVRFGFDKPVTELLSEIGMFTDQSKLVVTPDPVLIVMPSLVS